MTMQILVKKRAARALLPDGSAPESNKPLPLVPDQATRIGRIAEEFARERLRLLIVDDDFMFTEMLPRHLRKCIARPVLEIVTASSPSEARRLLGADPFDVFLCDFDLRSDESGLDLLLAARERSPPPLRILMTGQAALATGRAPPTAFDAFLEKPATLREIVTPLAEILRDRLRLEIELRD